jgi:hypothetical protein
LWVLPGFGSTTNNRTFGISYARAQEEGLKAFTWTRGGACAGIRIHPTTGRREVLFGGNADGFVTREDQADRSISNGTTAYTMRLKTPRLLFAEVDAAGKPRPYGVGNLQRMGLRSISTGNWNVNVNARLDRSAGQSLMFNQGTQRFIFGTNKFGDPFGGGVGQTAFQEPVGEGRALQLDFTQGGLNQDAHLVEASVDWKPTAFSKASNVVTGE